MLSQNPNVFNYNYSAMRENMKNSRIAEELMKVTWKPDRLYKLCDTYGLDFGELMEILD